MSDSQRKMTLTKEGILEFVKLIEMHPIIWDHNMRDHRDSNMCDVAWADIRDKMRLDPDDVTLTDLRRWWKGFRDTFRDNLQRVKEATRNDSKDFLRPSWWLWEPMQFARPFITTKGGEEHCASKYVMRKRKLNTSSMDLCMSQQMTQLAQTSQQKRPAIRTNFVTIPATIPPSSGHVYHSPSEGAFCSSNAMVSTGPASNSAMSVEEKEKDRFDRWAEYAATEMRQLPTDDALDLLNKYQHLLSAKWLEIAKREKKN